MRHTAPLLARHQHACRNDVQRQAVSPGSETCCQMRNSLARGQGEVTFGRLPHVLRYSHVVELEMRGAGVLGCMSRAVSAIRARSTSHDMGRWGCASRRVERRHAWRRRMIFRAERLWSSTLNHGHCSSTPHQTTPDSALAVSTDSPEAAPVPQPVCAWTAGCNIEGRVVGGRRLSPRPCAPVLVSATVHSLGIIGQ